MGLSPAFFQAAGSCGPRSILALCPQPAARLLPHRERPVTVEGVCESVSEETAALHSTPSLNLTWAPCGPRSRTAGGDPHNRRHLLTFLLFLSCSTLCVEEKNIRLNTGIRAIPSASSLSPGKEQGPRRTGTLRGLQWPRRVSRPWEHLTPKGSSPGTRRDTALRRLGPGKQAEYFLRSGLSLWPCPSLEGGPGP